MYNKIANTMISTSHASRVHGYTVVLFGMEFLISIPVMSIWRLMRRIHSRNSQIGASEKGWRISGLNNLLARDLARWLVWRLGAYRPRRPKAAGMWPVACGPHGPPPAPMPRSRASPGSDARHRPPGMILGFAEYALFFPIYICLSFSLSLLFRQSLLYDSQFTISIRTRLISTQLVGAAGSCGF